MGGIACGGDAWACYRDNIENALRWSEGSGLQLLIEPLNHRDRPGYILSSSDRAAALIADLADPSLRMMFDVYHVQISEGDLTTRLTRHLPSIAHVQIAAVPSRREPDEGEINYPSLLRELDAMGYAGHVGCEYRPRAQTEDGLNWMKAFNAP